MSRKRYSSNKSQLRKSLGVRLDFTSLLDGSPEKNRSNSRPDSPAIPDNASGGTVNLSEAATEVVPETKRLSNMALDLRRAALADFTDPLLTQDPLKTYNVLALEHPITFSKATLVRAERARATLSAHYMQIEHFQRPFRVGDRDFILGWNPLEVIRSHRRAQKLRSTASTGVSHPLPLSQMSRRGRCFWDITNEECLACFNWMRDALIRRYETESFDNLNGDFNSSNIGSEVGHMPSANGIESLEREKAHISEIDTSKPSLSLPIVKVNNFASAHHSKDNLGSSKSNHRHRHLHPHLPTSISLDPNLPSRQRLFLRSRLRRPSKSRDTSSSGTGLDLSEPLSSADDSAAPIGGFLNVSIEPVSRRIMSRASSTSSSLGIALAKREEWKQGDKSIIESEEAINDEASENTGITRQDHDIKWNMLEELKTGSVKIKLLLNHREVQKRKYATLLEMHKDNSIGTSVATLTVAPSELKTLYQAVNTSYEYVSNLLPIYLKFLTKEIERLSKTKSRVSGSDQIDRLLLLLDRLISQINTKLSINVKNITEKAALSNNSSLTSQLNRDDFGLRNLLFTLAEYGIIVFLYFLWLVLSLVKLSQRGILLVLRILRWVFW